MIKQISLEEYLELRLKDIESNKKERIKDRYYRILKLDEIEGDKSMMKGAGLGALLCTILYGSAFYMITKEPSSFLGAVIYTSPLALFGLGFGAIDYTINKRKYSRMLE